MPLIDELRLHNIPALSFSREKARTKQLECIWWHLCFEAGKVCTRKQGFAEEVIEEIASFPYGDHDDFCDSMTMALMRFRQGGFIYLDGEDEEEDYVPRMRSYY